MKNLNVLTQSLKAVMSSENDTNGCPYCEKITCYLGNVCGGGGGKLSQQPKDQ